MVFGRLRRCPDNVSLNNYPRAGYNASSLEPPWKRATRARVLYSRHKFRRRGSPADGETVFLRDSTRGYQ